MSTTKHETPNPILLNWALRELLGALPERRDWFNPDAEKVLRAAVETNLAPAEVASEITALVDGYLTHGVLADQPNHREKLMRLARDVALKMAAIAPAPAVHPWDADNLRVACRDAAEALRKADAPLLANRLVSNVEAVLGNGTVAPPRAKLPADLSKVQHHTYASIANSLIGKHRDDSGTVYVTLADAEAAVRAAAEGIVHFPVKGTAMDPALSSAVTLESAQAAIEHVESHNGPGRAAQARAMLINARSLA
jgi:hypothetical protein